MFGGGRLEPRGATLARYSLVVASSGKSESLRVQSDDDDVGEQPRQRSSPRWCLCSFAGLPGWLCVPMRRSCFEHGRHVCSYCFLAGFSLTN
jgi:hypothetical protein